MDIDDKCCAITAMSIKFGHRRRVSLRLKVNYYIGFKRLEPPASVNDSSSVTDDMSGGDGRFRLGAVFRRPGRPQSASFSLDEFDVIDFDDHSSSSMVESAHDALGGNETSSASGPGDDDGGAEDHERTLLGAGPSDGGGGTLLATGGQYAGDPSSIDKGSGRDNRLCNCCEAFERFLVSSSSPYRCWLQRSNTNRKHCVQCML